MRLTPDQDEQIAFIARREHDLACARADVAERIAIVLAVLFFVGVALAAAWL